MERASEREKITVTKGTAAAAVTGAGGQRTLYSDNDV